MRVWCRLVTGLACVTGVLTPLAGTTLEQLSLDDMSRQSTAIVRARVTGSRSAYWGADIYTYFQLQVQETWKPSGQTITEVAVPGGVFNGVRQLAPGAPELKTGQDYVLFLWTSRSGLTQVIGLSQGVFKLSAGDSGLLAQRPAASELMLDRAGNRVTDSAVSLQARELHARVRHALGAAK